MFQQIPWADLLYACDLLWWDRYIDEVREKFGGECWGLEAEVAKYGVSVVEADIGGVGLGRHGVIHTGGNSGYQAINLLYFLGAKKIILLGYDMQKTGGKSHSHGDHPSGLNRSSDFSDWISRFGPLARDLRNNGIKVLNATRETALSCFERVNLEQALCT